MFRMIRTEIWKLKRYHIIWAGVFLMLLSVLLTIFSTTALDGTYWTFEHFAEQVIKNNVTMIFPMCITLIVEQQTITPAQRHLSGTLFLYPLQSSV